MPIVNIQGEQGVNIAEQKQFTGGGGSMLPEGVYQILLEMPETNPPSEAGKYAWTRVAGTVVAGLACAEPGQNPQGFVGRKNSEIFSHSPKAVGSMRALLEAAGVRYQIQEYQGGVQGLVFDTDHLYGKTIEVKIIHQADDRPGAKYPVQSRWVDLQPVGTFARANGGGAQAAPAPGQPAAAPAAFIPGGYVSHAPQQPVQQPAPAQAAPQGYGQQPAPQYPPQGGYAPQPAPAGFQGAPPPGYAPR